MRWAWGLHIPAADPFWPAPDVQGITQISANEYGQKNQPSHLIPEPYSSLKGKKEGRAKTLLYPYKKKEVPIQAASRPNKHFFLSFISTSTLWRIKIFLISRAVNLLQCHVFHLFEVKRNYKAGKWNNALQSNIFWQFKLGPGRKEIKQGWQATQHTWAVPHGPTLPLPSAR